jgi:myotubularin-related protein 1/2
MDSYYRTLRGFVVLIEKDWLMFGHQFGLRNGLISKDKTEDEFSPIFLQWLDCVHQIMWQNPQAFEFNMELVNFIADNLFSGRYGTFLFNSEKV